MIREKWQIRVLIDVILWVIATIVCMLWRWLDDKSEVVSYFALFAGMAAVWILVAWLLQLYRSYQETWLWQSMVSLMATVGAMVALCNWGLPYLPWHFSPRVAIWMVLVVGAMDVFVVIGEHYWKYATNMTIPVMTIEKRKNAHVTRPDEKRSKASIESIHQSVLSVTTEADYYMLRKKAHLDSVQTRVVCDNTPFSML